MNEQKIDLILKGIRLLIIDSNLSSKSIKDFNNEFLDIFTKKESDTEQKIKESLEESK